MLDEQESVTDENFIEEMWNYAEELGDFTSMLTELLNDLGEDNVDHKKLILEELNHLDGQLEDMRKEIENFFDEGFAPWGDEDDETICDILKESGKISQHHINLLEDILVTYYENSDRIFNVLRKRSD